ncbi:MAG: hypothetical protein WCB27_01785 [Thermoguttaceae bacterium]
MNGISLESAAIRAYRRGIGWADFWNQHGDVIRAAEPYNTSRYHRLVAHLLHLVCSGNLSGMKPAGEPWLLDDVPEPTDGRGARLAKG